MQNTAAKISCNMPITGGMIMVAYCGLDRYLKYSDNVIIDSASVKCAPLTMLMKGTNSNAKQNAHVKIPAVTLYKEL